MNIFWFIFKNSLEVSVRCVCTHYISLTVWNLTDVSEEFLKINKKIITLENPPTIKKI